jgi:predicted DCC family thiol-disulfide oxidoreductase YuxK
MKHQVKPIKSTQNPIIFFDGICNLCNSSVNFIIDRDQNRYFRFSALQSDAAIENLTTLEPTHSDLGTVILLENGTVYAKSTAALRIARKLDGLWPILYVLIIIPPFLRNFIYDFIARNRYKWFGKLDTCRIPEPELKSLFID